MNNIRRRYLFLRHPALALVHIGLSERAENDRESLCGGRSQGWQAVEIEPGDTRGICRECVRRHEAREVARAVHTAVGLAVSR